MSTKPQPVHGIDISHHQGGSLDFAGAAKRGLRWVYHKATEGDSYVDDMYTRRRKETNKAGIPFGAYHFARPEVGDARAEALHFLEVAKPQPGDLRPALDIETDEGLSLTQIRTWVETFCTVVEKAIGVQPVVYTPFDLGQAGRGRIIWRPRYNNSNTPPVLPWDIWQFSNGIYGVPNILAGIGHVDLNVMSKDLTVEAMRIPKPKPTRKTRTLSMAVAPMQFSDSTKEADADFAKIFARGHDVIFGTEVGPGSGSDEVFEARAKAGGYRIAHFARYDTWVAVKASLVKKGTWKTGADHALDRSSMQKPTPPGRWGDKAIVWAECEIEGIGVCAFGAVHPLTFGGAGQAWKEKSDDLHAAVCAEWIKKHGKGKAIAFLGGDWNLNDRKNDLTQGKWGGVSCWDELKTWPNTGHGNIDAVLRSTSDTRVLRFVSARVLTDARLPLATDHFLTEVKVEVAELIAA